MSAGITVSLDPEYAEKLARLAQRLHVEEDSGPSSDRVPYRLIRYRAAR